LQAEAALVQAFNGSNGASACKNRLPSTASAAAQQPARVLIATLA